MASGVFVISCIYENNRLLGFNLLDAYTHSTRTISCQQAIIALSKGGKINNLKLENGELKGKGGSLSRYTAINQSGELL